MKSFKTMRKEGKGFFKIISYVVIATFIISIFVIGSLSGMLGKGRAQIISVEGREVITKQLYEQINAAFRQVKNPNYQRYIFSQYVSTEISKLTMYLESDSQGLKPSLSSLAKAFKARFKMQKAMFEKKYNRPYYLSFSDFLKEMRKAYMTQVLYDHTKNGHFADELAIEHEYKLKNTTSSVEYVVYDYKEYLKNLPVKKEDLLKVYNKTKNQYVQYIEAKVLAYKTLKEAQEARKKIAENKKFEDEIFKKASTRRFKPGAFKEFYKLKNTANGKISVVFEGKKQFLIAKPKQTVYSTFAQLSKEEKFNLKAIALNKERSKYFEKFKKETLEKLKSADKDSFEAFAKKNAAVYGKTKAFSIRADEAVKDSVTEKPIAWLGAGNKKFFENAFQKQGTISPSLITGEKIYKLKVLDIKMATGTISAKEKEDIAKSVKERESKRFQRDFMQDVRSHYEIKYNRQRINQIFKFKG